MHETSIRPAITELERTFKKFSVWFKRKMPLPTITIQTQGRRRASGWYAQERWRSDDKQERISRDQHLCRVVGPACP
jgi:hypothetical protein